MKIGQPPALRMSAADLQCNLPPHPLKPTSHFARREVGLAKQASERASERTDGRTNGQTDERAKGRRNERMNERASERAEGWQADKKAHSSAQPPPGGGPRPARGVT